MGISATYYSLPALVWRSNFDVFRKARMIPLLSILRKSKQHDSAEHANSAFPSL